MLVKTVTLGELQPRDVLKETDTSSQRSISDDFQLLFTIYVTTFP